MPNRALLTLLSGLSDSGKENVRAFLEFSDRERRRQPEDVSSDLLVSLAFFNASLSRPN